MVEAYHTFMVCEYLFEAKEENIFWHTPEFKHNLKVLSFNACIAENKDVCPKTKIKGKVTPHCWRK